MCICCICLEPIEIEETSRELVCEHTFHRFCIDTWLLRNSSCPTCRHPVLGPEIVLGSVVEALDADVELGPGSLLGPQRVFTEDPPPPNVGVPYVEISSTSRIEVVAPVVSLTAASHIDIEAALVTMRGRPPFASEADAIAGGVPVGGLYLSSAQHPIGHEGVLFAVTEP